MITRRQFLFSLLPLGQQPIPKTAVRDTGSFFQSYPDWERIEYDPSVSPITLTYHQKDKAEEKITFELKEIWQILKILKSYVQV